MSEECDARTGASSKYWCRECGGSAFCVKHGKRKHSCNDDCSFLAYKAFAHLQHWHAGLLVCIAIFAVLSASSFPAKGVSALPLPVPTRILTFG